MRSAAGKRAECQILLLRTRIDTLIYAYVVSH